MIEPDKNIVELLVNGYILFHRRVHLLGMDQMSRIGDALQLAAGNESQYSGPESSAFTVIRQGNGLIEDVC